MCEKQFDNDKMLQVGMLFKSMDVDSDGRVLKPELNDYLTRF